PEKLAAFRLSAADALAAVREQNTQSTGGTLGNQPIANESEFTATILTQSRFTAPEEFASIILRANPDGSVIRLGDVARVELGAANYQFGMELAGQPAAGMAVQLVPGANALDRKSTRLNSSHVKISYAVFCSKKKNEITDDVGTCL